MVKFHFVAPFAARNYVIGEITFGRINAVNPCITGAVTVVWKLTAVMTRCLRYGVKLRKCQSKLKPSSVGIGGVELESVFNAVVVFLSHDTEVIFSVLVIRFTFLFVRLIVIFGVFFPLLLVFCAPCLILGLSLSSHF